MARLPEPYVGPRPFERAEEGCFFGREHEAEDLFSLVVAYRTVLVYAQSGAGKTSLINAKLIPKLEEEGFEILPVARVRGLVPAGMTPDEIPNLYAFNVLTTWNREDPRRLARMSLSEFLAERQTVASERRAGSPQVLIFDQFEELLTLYPERRRDREDFFRQVAEVLADRFSRVVFVMREDYVAQLDPYARRLPEKLRTRFRLERLQGEAALAAIARPLLGTDRSFAPGVAEKMVQDLLRIRAETGTGETCEIIGEFVEPVQLQVVCQGLWRALPPEVTEIDATHLQTFGDTDRALAKFYEDAIQAAAVATGVHPNLLREWCEAWLITSTGTRGTVHRGHEETQGVPNTVVDVLEDRHLIRSEWRAGARWYELTHDRFVSPLQASNLRWNEERQRKKLVAFDLMRKMYDMISRKAGEEELLQIGQEALAIGAEIGDPSGMARALACVGDVYRIHRRYDLALESDLRALEIADQIDDPQLALSLLLPIGHGLFDRERYAESVEYFSRYIQAMPEDARGYHGRAAAYWYAGVYRDAFQDFTHELELSPGSVAAYNGRGQVLAESGNYKAAVKDLKRVLELESDTLVAAYAKNGLGLAYAGLKKYRLALRTFAESIAGSPHNAWVYYNRSAVYEWMGRREQAIEDLKISLEMQAPRLPPVKRERAERHLRELTGRTA